MRSLIQRLGNYMQLYTVVLQVLNLLYSGRLLNCRSCICLNVRAFAYTCTPNRVLFFFLSTLSCCCLWWHSYFKWSCWPDHSAWVMCKCVGFSCPNLLTLLANHKSALALPGESLGVTERITHSITLKPDARPSYVPSYRLPHSQRAVVKDKIDKILTQGIIQESHSTWNSPLFLVPKKNGTFRPVIDFRKVNELTVLDHYPLPVLSDLL